MSSHRKDLLEQLRKAIRHIDDAIEKVRDDCVTHGVDCDIEDAINDLRRSFYPLNKEREKREL